MDIPESDNTFKKKALSAIIWNAIQRYGTLIVAFVSNIILARLLTPNEFGLIGLLTVFISLANTIAESGFNTALIQKKNVEEIDYNTVFYWNIGISVALFFLLYLLAPYIAAYFDRPILSSLLRVESIILIVDSFCIVQTTRLMKGLQFKILAIRRIVATIISSAVGIILALRGFGVWSLVWQAIVASIAGAVLLWKKTDWRPSWQYNWSALRSMFKFGAYISVSSICNTLYINFQSFIIGKCFSISELGYYTQAKRLERIPVEGTASVLNTVLFPIYSTIVDDRERHISLVRKNIKLITFVTFPLMLSLILVAPYVFHILFTDKWNESVPMFQILCVFGMVTPLNMANVEIFKSLGEGRIYLMLQTVKRVIGVCMVLFFVRYGVLVMLWAVAAYGFISYILNIGFTHHVFGYDYKMQLSDILVNLLLAVTLYVFLIFLYKCINVQNDWIGLIFGVGGYFGLYFIVSYSLNLSSYKLIKELLSRH